MDHESRGWTIAYWLCQAVGWGIYVIIGLVLVIPQTGPQPVVIGGYGLFYFYSIGLTHGLRALIRRRQWLSLPPGQAALRLVPGAVVVGTVQCVIIFLVQAVWKWTFPPVASLSLVLSMWANTTGATFVWTMIYTGVSALQRSRRSRHVAIALELGMREARLQTLEAQVNPHFLFNCLNSVRGMILEDPPRAQDMVTRLANILRHSLVRRVQATEPLADQVAIIADYLELESIRLEERLRARIEIDPATLDCQVPWMLLQTLVENAIKHGIARLAEGGELVVRSRIHDGSLEIVVENSGSLGPSPAGSTQVGLANLRERLRLLHGDVATLELSAPAASRVRATARMPYRPAVETPARKTEPVLTRET